MFVIKHLVVEAAYKHIHWHIQAKSITSWSRQRRLETGTRTRVSNILVGSGGIHPKFVLFIGVISCLLMYIWDNYLSFVLSFVINLLTFHCFYQLIEHLKYSYFPFLLSFVIICFKLSNVCINKFNI